MAIGSTKNKDSELERWTAVVLRSLHLAGVVWVGAFVVAGQAVDRTPALLMLVSGLVMLAMDLRAGRIALVAWMALDPRQVVWIFWLLLVGSSIASHAPKGFRHWPTKKQASGAAVPRDTTPSRG
jgi:hypothetical protein